jgi:hypothetical protein
VLAVFRLRLLPLALLWSASAALAGSDPALDFSRERAMGHVHALANLQSRTAGTSGESKAIKYVASKLRSAGLDVRTEPFEFTGFDLIRATLRAGDLTVEPTRVLFDPYRSPGVMKAGVAFVSAETVNSDRGVRDIELSRRIVITTKEANSFRIALRDPTAIAVVSNEDFAKLQVAGAAQAELATIGKLTIVHSANLVANTRPMKPAGDIILSAHIDSAGTPGAQDNASGVALVLELAQHLSRLDLPFRLRFVFFGAEEFGLLGSRAYVEQHHEDLQRCQLLFNLDSVGGKEIYIDMRGGVRNVSPTRGVSQMPREYSGKATGSVNGRWGLLHNRFPDASNVPAWLQTAILDAVQELGYPIHQSQGAGSDHAVFADAGIVATDIATGGLKSHVPEDLPDQIDSATLERVARIVAGVVRRIQPQR